MFRFALGSAEISQLQSILQAGISKSTYNMVAQYLIPRGFGWAQASGIARGLVSDFKPTDFAEQWYKPYQNERQQKEIIKQGTDSFVSNRNLIETPLKQNTRYSYQVSFSVLDAEGNYSFTGYKTLYSDDKLSPEDVIDKTIREYDIKSKYPLMETPDFKVLNISHNEGWNY